MCGLCQDSLPWSKTKAHWERAPPSDKQVNIRPKKIRNTILGHFYQCRMLYHQVATHAYIYINIYKLISMNGWIVLNDVVLRLRGWLYCILTCHQVFIWYTSNFASPSISYIPSPPPEPTCNPCNLYFFLAGCRAPGYVCCATACYPKRSAWEKLCKKTHIMSTSCLFTPLLSSSSLISLPSRCVLILFLCFIYHLHGAASLALYYVVWY